jgi:hypothetical protein
VFGNVPEENVAPTLKVQVDLSFSLDALQPDYLHRNHNTAIVGNSFMKILSVQWHAFS